MDSKRIRYITSIFTLDKKLQSFGVTRWDDEDITDYINTQEKHYGLYLIKEKEEVLVTIEYTNIIWVYRIYYGSCKKKYKELEAQDERWSFIEKRLITDLKMMGLEDLKDNILLALKNKEYFELHKKIDKQFKNYCV